MRWVQQQPMSRVCSEAVVLVLRLLHTDCFCPRFSFLIPNHQRDGLEMEPACVDQCLYRRDHPSCEGTVSPSGDSQPTCTKAEVKFQAGYLYILFSSSPYHSVLFSYVTVFCYLSPVSQWSGHITCLPEAFMPPSTCHSSLLCSFCVFKGGGYSDVVRLFL